LLRSSYAAAQPHEQQHIGRVTGSKLAHVQSFHPGDALIRRHPPGVGLPLQVSQGFCHRLGQLSGGQGLVAAQVDDLVDWD
jgi:hypothetical protein